MLSLPSAEVQCSSRVRVGGVMPGQPWFRQSSAAWRILLTSGKGSHWTLRSWGRPPRRGRAPATGGRFWDSRRPGMAGPTARAAPVRGQCHCGGVKGPLTTGLPAGSDGGVGLALASGIGQCSWQCSRNGRLDRNRAPRLGQPAGRRCRWPSLRHRFKDDRGGIAAG